MPAKDRICLRDNCMLMRNGNKRIRVKTTLPARKPMEPVPVTLFFMVCGNQ